MYCLLKGIANVKPRKIDTFVSIRILVDMWTNSRKCFSLRGVFNLNRHAPGSILN